METRHASYSGPGTGLYEQITFKRFMEDTGRRKLQFSAKYSLYHGCGEQDVLISLTTGALCELSISGSVKDLGDLVSELERAELAFPEDGLMAQEPVTSLWPPVIKTPFRRDEITI